MLNAAGDAGSRQARCRRSDDDRGPPQDWRNLRYAGQSGRGCQARSSSMHPGRGFALSDMTGVLRSFRGGGVSIAVNRRLGFADEQAGLGASVSAMGMR